MGQSARGWDRFAGRGGKGRAPETTPWRRLRWLILAGGLALAAAVAFGVWYNVNAAQTPTEAPEAEKVLAVQADMPFQILIPAYLPKEFDRANAAVNVNQSGPSGEPMVEMVYRTASNQAVFVRQWVPGNPEKEVLAGSRIVETKWGKGWLLTQVNLTALWVDIGALRVSVFTNDSAFFKRDQVVGLAESLGPASGRQVFYFLVDKPVLRDIPPAPPMEVQPNAEGVQEFTLTITPGGYSPIRFAVKKGVPVRINFRALGQVGSGNSLTMPIGNSETVGATLESATDKKVIEFTPEVAGEFKFHCSHDMYRGIMVVRE